MKLESSQILLCVVLVMALVLGSGCGVRPLCDPSNCTGCCDVQDRCQQGGSSAACGRSGNLCTACGGGSLCVTGACSVVNSGGPGGGSQPTGSDQTSCMGYLNAMYDRCSPQVTAAQRQAVCTGMVNQLSASCLGTQRRLWDCMGANASTVVCAPAPSSPACDAEFRAAAQPCQ
jgi:hypothetical protein